MLPLGAAHNVTVETQVPPPGFVNTLLRHCIPIMTRIEKQFDCLHSKSNLQHLKVLFRTHFATFANPFVYKGHMYFVFCGRRITKFAR